ncbi:hypothetical protein Riv7116_1166 [Rivularia sp. PCC 7116]|uniref:hypothetical protein n=1 Tax=Rivularia sp. PCC 7116 TaxID=373994 RepID=UPI00029ECE12|nr:hypothetical protein [Rivularia sp. PCC 7116]AFY53737.1 hypothetical protein Riv7116_1166 [Rivularia sp. PCC 7116]
MSAKKINQRNTKNEILEAYDELSKERLELKKQVDQLVKAGNSVKAENFKKLDKTPATQYSKVQQKMNFTIENLAKIQLGFGSAANELSEQLTTKASRLAEIKQIVEEQLEQLQQLHDLEVVDDTLDNLIASYEENNSAYQEEFHQLSDTLNQEIQELRAVWRKEQEEYQRTAKERNENLNKNRQRDISTYKYDLERERNLEVDEYEQQQKELYRALDEFQQETEKQWNERETAISEKEKEFEDLKVKVEAFPQQKEAAIKKASEKGKGIAEYQAKIKANLFAKEVEGEKASYEQKIQSLQQTIDSQEERVQNLSKQLDSALKQVQDLAVKAIEGSANVNTYQAMKEIALEQAKNQAKNK